jgi:two-component system response regulator FixJ
MVQHSCVSLRLLRATRLIRPMALGYRRFTVLLAHWARDSLGGTNSHEIARGFGAVAAPLAESRGAMTVLIGRQISVIDGNAGVRDAIFAMLDGVGFAVRTYMSAGHFLSDYTSRGGCIVANILLPDMDGLELLQLVTRQGMDKPVVLFSEEADVPLAVATMKAGAVDFLLHPFDAMTLVSTVEHALRIGWKTSQRGAEARAARTRLALLTPRERHVLDQLVMGQPNKMVAHALGISARTVEFHRAHVMDKLGARNMSDLMRLALLVEEASEQLAEDLSEQPRAATGTRR